jgi:tetratricopeptide (TPR) repeat protein
MDHSVAVNELGQFHWQCGDLPAAQEQFERLLSIGQSEKSAQLCETAWNNLAVVHRELGDFVQAAICQQQAWKAALDLADAAELSPGSLACQLTNRANDAILARDFRLAERLLWSALRCDRLAGNLADEAADWGSLGIVSSLTGNLAAARSRFEQAHQIHAQLGDDRGMGCDLVHLAELALVDGDLAAARGLVNRSLVHFERAGCAGLVDRAHASRREIAARQRLASFDPARN